jgi:hypothetical protein
MRLLGRRGGRVLDRRRWDRPGAEMASGLSKDRAARVVLCRTQGPALSAWLLCKPTTLRAIGAVNPA